MWRSQGRLTLNAVFPLNPEVYEKNLLGGAQGREGDFEILHKQPLWGNLWSLF